jgi:hypothetical protein
METTQQEGKTEFSRGEMVVTRDGRVGVIKDIDGDVANVVRILDLNSKIEGGVDDSSESFTTDAAGLSSATSRDLSIASALFQEFQQEQSQAVLKMLTDSVRRFGLTVTLQRNWTSIPSDLTDEEYIAKLKETVLVPLARGFGLPEESALESLRHLVAQLVEKLSGAEMLGLLRSAPGISVAEFIDDFVNGSTEQAEAALLLLRPLKTESSQFVTVEQHLDLAKVVSMQNENVSYLMGTVGDLLRAMSAQKA